MVVSLLAGLSLTHGVDVGQDMVARRFRAQPQFRVWALLIAANFTIWPLVLFASVRWWTELKGLFPQAWLAERRVRRGALVLATVATLYAVVALPPPYAFGGGLRFLDPWQPRLAVAVAGGLLASLPAAFATVAIALSAQQTTHAGIADLIAVRRTLGRFLAVLGGVIGAGVLAFGALRDAVDAIPEGSGELPEVLVPLYGGLLTVALATIYVPAHAALARLGGHHVDAVATPAEILAADDIDTVNLLVEKRRFLQGLLGTGMTAEDRLGSAVWVLAPVLSGMASFLIG